MPAGGVHLRVLGPNDIAVIQVHHCSVGYVSTGEGGNVETGCVGKSVPAQLLPCEAATANLIAENIYQKAVAADPETFQKLKFQKLRPGVDNVIIKSAFGGADVRVTARLLVPISLQDGTFIEECLMVKELFGGQVDVVLGQPFYTTRVKKVVECEGVKKFIFCE